MQRIREDLRKENAALRLAVNDLDKIIRTVQGFLPKFAAERVELDRQATMMMVPPKPKLKVRSA
jgi:hypothetical protein